MVSPSQIEIVRPGFASGTARHCLFDFDGTLSLLREGWQQVMVPMMVDILMQTPRHESQEALTALVRDYVDRLTGKDTIYQMIQLADEVRARGMEPLDPLAYKYRYLDLLWQRIAHRVQGVKDGTIPREQMLLPGSIALLEALNARGVTCYLASGTDIAFVQNEAEALGLTRYFRGGVYGALDDWRSFSKAILIQRILSEHHLEGSELLGFGDGFVEIENVVAVGGTAVGVASDEVRPGRVNIWKRQRLVDAGARLIIADFSCADELMALLFGP
jgi:phosphoglycolate phosphatase